MSATVNILATDMPIGLASPPGLAASPGHRVVMQIQPIVNPIHISQTGALPPTLNMARFIGMHVVSAATAATLLYRRVQASIIEPSTNPSHHPFLRLSPEGNTTTAQSIL
jgi:hypothetical protein